MRFRYLALASAVMMVHSGVSPAAVCSATLQNKVGDIISVTATLFTSDPNENGEGEPLVIGSSGGEISATIGAYFVPTPFTYKATAANETISGSINGIDGDETCSIAASVNPAQPFSPDQKQKAGNLSGKLGVGGAITAIAGGALCTVATGGVCGAVIIGGAGLGGLGAVAGNIASDPADPNYTVIAVPTISNIPPVTADASITQAEADGFNALFANQAAIIGVGNAAYISGNRAQGAHVAGDSGWETKQVQATQLYAQELSDLFAKQATLLTNLRNALSSAGFSVYVTPNDTLNFEYQMAYQGLPANIVNALATYGAMQDQINQVRNLFLVQDINVASGNFPDALVSPTLISAFQSAATSFAGVLKVSLSVGDDSSDVSDADGKGIVAVAILGTDSFNVASLDPATARFGPNGAAPTKWMKVRDVNGDGKPDLVLHFKKQDIGFQCGDTVVVLTAKTQSGEMVSGAARLRPKREENSDPTAQKSDLHCDAD